MIKKIALFLFIIISFLLVSILLFFVLKKENLKENAYKKNPQSVGLPSGNFDKNKNYIAILETSDGDIEISIRSKTSPISSQTFIDLARKGFYNNITFHIVTDNFVQTGDPTGTGSGGPGYVFETEVSDSEYVRGTVSFVGSVDGHKNGSQFFIVGKSLPKDTPKSNSLFANVTKGIEVVDNIIKKNVSKKNTVILKKVVIKEI